VRPIKAGGSSTRDVFHRSPPIGGPRSEPISDAVSLGPTKIAADESCTRANAIASAGTVTSVCNGR
jgi:hypothetical protein